MTYSPSEIVNPRLRYYRLTFTFQDDKGEHIDHVFLRSKGGSDLRKKFWRFVNDSIGLANCYGVRIITVVFWLDD
jgi:phage-related protein